MGGPYTESFFAEQEESSLASARHVAPIVVDLVRPRSVVDVGCGRGAWLAAFKELGVDDLTGIDGPWVGTEHLLIDPLQFRSIDLEQQFELERRFDLALSLEVAEHLPRASAATFVDSLVRLAPAVLFSAAIPGQGGVMHVNEQWPDYWVGLFSERGYDAIDAIRPRVWDLDEVDWWYAQNAMLFVWSGELAETVRSRAGSTVDPIRSLVHPRLYEGMRQASENETLREVLHRFPTALRRSIAWHLRRRR